MKFLTIIILCGVVLDVALLDMALVSKLGRGLWIGVEQLQRFGDGLGV